MYDQSELEELYDDFLHLDGSMFSEFNVDSNILENDLSESESETENRCKRIDNGRKYPPRVKNNNINNNNNFIDGTSESFADSILDDPALDLHLDLLNRNLIINNGNYLDKNGKVHKRGGEDDDEDALKTNDERPTRPTSLFTKTKENEIDMELKEVDEKKSSPDILFSNDAAFHRSDWGPESLGLWHSGPSSLSLGQNFNNNAARPDSLSNFSISASYTSGYASEPMSLDAFSMTQSRRAYSHQQFGHKVEMVYSLLSMLRTGNRDDMSKTLLAMSSSEESCQAMRQSGVIPLLIQLIHSPELEIDVRNRAAEALRNIVHAQKDDKRRRREAKVLKLLQQIREYCDLLKIVTTHQDPDVKDDIEKHPVQAIENLMKFSFDGEHREAMCTLGGLQAIAELIQLDNEAHGSKSEHQQCILLRRFAGMSLTNLTFGDGNNKSLLCGFNKFMRALVDQLRSPSEDLRQVTASVLRNLSWRADKESKDALCEVGVVSALMISAMEWKKESTLKSVLSALWNLSAHSTRNHVDICSVPGALAFLVKLLKFKATSNTAAIVENAGGILRNISSHIAVQEEYRQILRDNNCFEILLEQLKSSSLTIVSNACGTLWNLSAMCPQDQQRLWEMGAATMLRSLINSKHKMISMGSSAALKNLLSANPSGNMLTHLDSTARGLGLQSLPSLFVRKQKALEQELDITLSETCDNIEPSGSPTHSDRSRSRSEDKRTTHPKRSDSKESVTSTQSDSVYERVNQLLVKNESKILESKNVTLHGSLSENESGRKMEEQKLMRKYKKTSLIPTPAFKKLTQEKKNERTKEEANAEAETKEQEEKAPEGKEKCEPKRGIPVLKGRIKPKQEESSSGHGSRYGACCPRSNSSSSSASSSNNYYEEENATGYKDNNKKPDNSKGGNKKNFEGLRDDYAETDLDQIINFSLKYGEETSCDDESKNRRFNYYEGDKTKEPEYLPAEPEDTTIQFCTEGTPYEGTPYNFSSSNSLTDLRVIDEETGDASKNIEEKPDTASADQKSRNMYENGRKHYENSVKRLSREFESGISTPERPKTYCEEGTPGACISRVSSLSSITSGKESSSKNSPEKSEEKKSDKEFKNIEDSLQNKAVTFGNAERLPSSEQTPLMFSRTSSMNSLNSFQDAHRDDRSSVVSDFSRMTSGMISPSELPDSPTQTVPPSPKGAKTPVSFHGKMDDSGKKSVFDDGLATYKQEDTPLDTSRAISPLSIISDDAVKAQPNTRASSLISADDASGKDEAANKNCSDKDQIVPDKTELERERLDLNSVTEEEGNLVTDLINTGISATSRPRQSHNRRALKNNYVDCNKPISGIPIKSGPRNVYPSYEGSDDVVHLYREEGTPASISHAGSHSDLTTFSPITGMSTAASGTGDISDDGSYCSEDQESILADCIQTGMPKVKPQKEKNRNGNIDDAMGLTLNKGMGVVAFGSNSCSNNQSCNEYLRRKDQNLTHLTAIDEFSTFVTEDSPCLFSVRSSLSDLTVNSVDLPGCPSRPDDSREQSAHLLSPAPNTSQPSPSSISLIESEDGAKMSEDQRPVFSSPKSMDEDAKYWNKGSHPNTRDASFLSDEGIQNLSSYSEDMITAVPRPDSPLSSLSMESYDSCEPTALEQALLEECIHFGMPAKNNSKKSENKMMPVHMNPMEGDIRFDQSNSKNLNISSATVDEITEADEKKQENRESMKTRDAEAITTSTISKSEGSDSIKIKNEFLMKSSVEIKTEENMNGSFGGHTWSEDYTSPNESSIASPSCSDRVEGLKVISDESDNSKRKDEMLLPNFKIGSEITDPKFFQAEASKICREIRKYQEFDMGASITSEMSIMSCNSFLDSGEFSIFETPNTDVVDFETSDNHSLNRNLSKLKNFPGRKGGPFTVASEPISLPSLGSIKPDLIEAIDLESSIISVASITSEIADTSSKDKDLSLASNQFDNDDTVENVIDTATATLDKGDETLNADTLGSDTEIFDDENSIHSQENLPLDSESSKESTPKKSNNRKLTPKEKRQTIQDRYRTYTIRDLKAGYAEVYGEAKAEVKKKLTPKQRRMNDRDRFLTRVLDKKDMVYHNQRTGQEKVDETDEKFDDDEQSQSLDLSSPPSSMTNSLTKKKTNIPKFRSSKLSKSSRKLDKERYRTRTLESKPLVVSPAERKELADNARLVAICLKTAAHDGDSELSLVSDSEADISNRTLPIDTATYNKTNYGEIDYRPSEDEYQSFDSYLAPDLEDDYEKKGPKILKPGEKPDEDVDESPLKVVRGRRKQLYSSPIKKISSPVQKKISSTPPSPKIVQNTLSPKKYALATTKSLPNVPKNIPRGPEAPVLCREGTFTKEEATVMNKGVKNTTRSIPVLTKKTDVKNPNSNTRLAIRNKSAPVLRNAKSVPENNSKANSRPASSYVSKIGNDGNLNHKRHSSAGAATVASNKLPGSNISNIKRHSSSGITTAMKNSPSNQSIKSTGSVKSVSSVKAKSTVSQTSKSPSNVSLDSATSADKGVPKGKPKTPKKEVTSKIASLWKKVEESKKKDKNVKDNRVWITAKKEEKVEDEILVIEKEEILELSSGKIVRSSTFQGLGDGALNASDICTKSFDESRNKSLRNSGDFSSAKWETEKNSTFEGRNIISAIVPPYNYSPPSNNVHVTSAAIKQVETFHKGSMKVTTV